MTHVSAVAFFILSCLSQQYLADTFSDINYCKLNCPNELHVACPQPCFSNDCAFMPPTYEFRAHMLSFHNNLRDVVASGKFSNFSSASDMRALSYDMELEFLAYCWASKHHQGLNACAKTNKGEDVGQTQIVIIKNTVIPDQLRAGLDGWIFQNKSLTPDIIKRFEPEKWGQEYESLTQIISARTMRMGCSRCRMTMGRTYITCYYCPPGNIIGRPLYKMGPPATQCPKGTKPNKYYKHLCGSMFMPGDGYYVFTESAVKSCCMNYLIGFCLIITAMGSKGYA